MKKTAIIVGGGQTLGAFLSKGVAQAGYHVAIADLNGENAQHLAKEIEKDFSSEGIQAVGYAMDATKEAAVRRTLEEVKSTFGRLDLLVYSAGVAIANKITHFSEKDFSLCCDVNLKGYFLCAKEASRIMIPQGEGGNIIVINSKSGKVGSKHNSGYSASKFGAVGLTQSLALDLAEHNIRVNGLMLGNLLKSPMFQSLIPQYAKKLGVQESEVEKNYMDKVPLGRGCEYQDVLDMLLFYASDKAGYCTGQSINITGGQVMF